MARTLYGGSPADVIAQISTDDGDYAPATATLTAWDAATGGSQLTDLLDATGSAATVVTPDVLGRVLFQGPDAYDAAVWLEDADSNRWRIEPSDLATRTGGVATVNGASGAVTLDLDDIDDSATRVAMATAERTKLTGIATAATANATDATLKARANHTGQVHSNVVTDDIDAQGGVNGQYLRKDPADGVVRLMDPDDPVDPTSGTFALSDATDYDDAAPAPVAGNLLVSDGSDYSPGRGAFAAFVLNSGQSIPVGALPGIYWDKAATTVLKAHVMEGTPGATAAFNTGSVNFSAFTGAAVTFSSAQAMVGSTSVRIAAGNVGYYADTGLALDTIVAKRRIRFDGTPGGTVNFAEMRSTSGSIAALQRDTSGVVKMKDGAGQTRLTTTTTLAPDTWYIYEWKVGGAQQQLRIYSATGTLLQDTGVTTATAGQIDASRTGVVIYTSTGGSLYLDDSAVGADWLGATG